MVGDTLRQAREKQGLTIANVAEETSIREAYLEAIEKGNYDELPGDVYAKGFIRNYSKFLQIDGDALLQEYAAERNLVKEIQPVDAPQPQEPEKPKKSIFSRSKAKEIKPQEPAQVAEPPKQKTNLFASGDDYRHRLEREEKSGSRKFMILLAVMVVFLGGVYVAFMDDGSENTATKAPAAKVEQQKSEPEKKIEGIEIKAKLLENCWISVSVDGTSVFEGTAEKGKEFTWKGKNTVEIVAGNAGGVEITENGKAVGKLGEDGQVAEKTFKAEIPGKDEPKSEQNSQQSPQENSPAVEERTSHESRYTEPEPQPEAAAPVEPTPAPAPAAAEPAPEPAAQPAAGPAPAEGAASAAAEG